jgi:hypothetical protein
MAERGGFEPPVGSHLRLISSQVHSTALPPLQKLQVQRAANDTGRVTARQGATLVSRHDAAAAMSEILVPVSFGELLDKISILQIKSERISDPAKLRNVRNELSALEQTWMAHPAAGGNIVQLRAELKAVNERLWVIEDDIRLQEKAQAFDATFIQLARSVYFQNDMRARIKRDINLALGSAYVEEKSYQDYGAGKGA